MSREMIIIQYTHFQSHRTLELDVTSKATFCLCFDKLATDIRVLNGNLCDFPPQNDCVK